MPGTLLDRVWDEHVVRSRPGEPDLLYVDLHLVQEVSSPQAFEGLRIAGRPVRRPDLTLATADHAVATRTLPLLGDAEDEGVSLNLAQVAALRDNCREHGIALHDVGSARQGIVHVIGPELGLTQPGMTIVCGDSHTTTHGAFGALALGIGSSEVEHVLATQCLWLHRPRTLLVRIEGTLAAHVTAKDLSLALIHRYGAGGATGYAIEYQGEVVDALSMEERMTLCNMSIETGARVGMVAPDETTLAYLRGRPSAPEGAALEAAREEWERLRSDADARFDEVWHLDASTVQPMVTWGTTPAMSVPVDGSVPEPASCADPVAAERALDYMGLEGGEAIGDLTLDRVFIGSCTNGRIEDLRAAAAVVRGRHVADHVEAMVVPGSASVRRQAEEEGLGDVFEAAGFSWRLPGCSMCVAINDDRLEPGQRCASTSNRNFEGRQGAGGRTHLVSPAMAAAAAVHGRFVDVRALETHDPHVLT